MSSDTPKRVLPDLRHRDKRVAGGVGVSDDDMVDIRAGFKVKTTRRDAAAV